MMAWRPMARRIFGLNDEGARAVSPPSLIIQDELHLISGPLGSMVGLYEPVVDELCTDRRPEVASSRQIIASTATIRRYQDQIKGLFGRDQVALFPLMALRRDVRLCRAGIQSRREPGAGAPLCRDHERFPRFDSNRAGPGCCRYAPGGRDNSGSRRDGYWTNRNSSTHSVSSAIPFLSCNPTFRTTSPGSFGGTKSTLDACHWTMEPTSRRAPTTSPRRSKKLEVRYVAGKKRQEAMTSVSHRTSSRSASTLTGLVS